MVVALHSPSSSASVFKEDLSVSVGHVCSLWANGSGEVQYFPPVSINIVIFVLVIFVCVERTKGFRLQAFLSSTN